MSLDDTCWRAPGSRAGNRGLSEDSKEPGSDQRVPSAAPPEVARKLIGNMPCVVCGYNLKTLSVRHVCPECGTPVRATVLAVVDPYASVLQPIRFPRATAVGIVVWSCAALCAALLTWGQRFIDVFAVWTGENGGSGALAFTATVLIVVSAAGATALIRPHKRIAIWKSLAATISVALCGVHAALYWKLHGIYDPLHTRPFVEAVDGQEIRTWLRLGGSAVLAAAIMGLRPNARELAARSLVLRMGRADRQTMLAMVAALGLAMIGDVVTMIARSASGSASALLEPLGTVLIAVGSMLFTAGLVGVMVDCLRIASVIVRPSRTMGETVEMETEGDNGERGG